MEACNYYIGTLTTFLNDHSQHGNIIIPVVNDDNALDIDMLMIIIVIIIIIGVDDDDVLLTVRTINPYWHDDDYIHRPLHDVNHYHE